MENESYELKEMIEKIKQKKQIKNNPFALIPQQTLEEALQVLNEFSDEITKK